MLTLSDKLKSLGVKIGARDLPPPAPRNGYGIEQVLTGRPHSTPYGSAYVVETVYPPHYRHGCAPLQVTAPLHTVAAWARETRLAECDHSALVFLDTETTGLAGGTGTYAFLVGVGRYQPATGDFRVVQFFLRDPSEEEALLEALTEFLHPCQALVTFNGKAFDVPLLNTRYVSHRRPTPLTQPAHLDLLPLARRLWRDRLASRALGSLEINILGASRSHEDVEGWLIPQLYFDYLRTGDARPLQGVFYHNAMDVLAMAALLSHVAGMLADPFDGHVEHGLDLIAIGRLMEDLGDSKAAVRLYRCGLSQDLPEPNYAETVRHLAWLERRRGDTPAAVELWTSAARVGHVYAHVELAKFYEHERHDYAEAARWTRAALELVTAPGTPLSLRREWLADLEHRMERVETRGQRQNGHK